MTGTIIPEDMVFKFIEQAIMSAVSKQMGEETEKAKKNLESIMREQIAAITLSVLKMYSVELNKGEIVIRVRNET